ncbi:MAG: hypothetical protein ACPGJV_07040 [Bacteriovoracaceae bacterium]
MSSKRKNPLYVVTNKGVDIETANNIIDALFKRLGLDSIYKYFEMLIEGIVTSLKDFSTIPGVLKSFQEFLDDLIKRMQLFINIVSSQA